MTGTAAGGGFPQWNCRCRMCVLFWDRDPRVVRRTQSSLAVQGASESSWVILNCSPDIREQIAAIPALQPNGSPRGSPIKAVMLTSGDIDHIGGLLSLREQCRFDLHATASVLQTIKENSIFNVLDKKYVTICTLGRETVLSGGITAEAFQVRGKLPLYIEGDKPVTDTRSAFTLGLRLTDEKGKAIAYVPACAAVDEALLDAIDNVDALFFDGTLWLDDEMITAGVGKKTGRRMGHLPISGPDGSLTSLKGIRCRQKFYVHINNTNPLVCEGSPERKTVEAAGWQVPPDGFELSL
ncbi:MAG: pyrroloquinoline quinone biosynthesis protein PqqB [Aestuariivirgaceae bacterium]